MLLTVLLSCGAAAAKTTLRAGCQRLSVPVALSPGRPLRYQVSGVLCGVRASAENQTIEVLVPGLTYTSEYWDFPYQPASYSYALHANHAGYATLAIDKVGTGASSQPPALELTQAAEVYTLHEVIRAVRHGQLGHAFGKVVLVGHSEGTFIGILEAGTYHDVDGLLETGFLDTSSPLLPLVFVQIPAQFDPVTASI